jgi:hypothetical protein
MIYAIPIIGHIIGFVAFASMALPFWLFWTAAGMGEKYFYFVPETYYNIGFWECWMVFSIISILKFMFIPKLFWRGNVSEKIEKIIKLLEKKLS